MLQLWPGVLEREQQGTRRWWLAVAVIEEGCGEQSTGGCSL